MDIIQRAQEKREWHLSMAAKLEAFLATAFDLKLELEEDMPAETKTDAEKADLPKKAKAPATRPMSGIGADTINAAEELVRQHGPMSTRDMLPMIRARGIPVAGNEAVATLSARLSGRGELVTYAGKWHFKDKLPPMERLASQKEATDTPTKDASAASLFVDREGGESYAPTLT